jgi:hypothetical protein
MLEVIMEFSFGFTNPTVVEVTNRQQHVEYRIISGLRVEERDVRAAVGNALRGTYSHSFSGWYSDRKPAIERMERDIEELKQKLKELEFAVKVTKKKSWKAI